MRVRAPSLVLLALGCLLVGCPASSLVVPSQARGGALLWACHLDQGAYGSLGISGIYGQIIAGTCFLEPCQAQLFTMLGDGTPDWTRAAEAVVVDAARQADCFAALAFGRDRRITLRVFRGESSIPLWSRSLPTSPAIMPAQHLRDCRVRVSDDGSMIVALIPDCHAGIWGSRLLAFGSEGGPPLVDSIIDGGDLVDVDLSPDGRFLALAAIPYVHVWDLRSGESRACIPGGPWCRAAIASDGHYLAVSALETRVLEWDGARYVELWCLPPRPDHWYGDLAFSPGGRLAVCRSWYGGAAIDIHFASNGAKLWQYKVSGPAHFDFDPCRFSPDGGILAARLAREYDDYQLYAFSPELSEPMLIADLPGPTTDLDLADDGHLAVTGMRAYDWQNHPGGYLHCYQVPGRADRLTTTTRLAFTSQPNPFNPKTTLRFSLPEAGEYRLSIHDAAGRSVHVYTAHASAGEHAYAWDAGGLPSGVYLARLEDR